MLIALKPRYGRTALMRGSSVVVKIVLPLCGCRPAASATPGKRLIDVHNADQVGTLRAGIRGFQNYAERKLALEAEGPVLHVRRAIGQLRAAREDGRNGARRRAACDVMKRRVA